MLNLIIFDCDGVLVDSEEITGSFFYRYLKEQGVRVESKTIIAKYQGQSLKAVVDDIEKLTKKPVPDTFLDQFRKDTMAAYAIELKPIEGIEKALSQIDTKKCVASNGPLKKMELTLGVTKLDRFFENSIFSAYDVQKWKPDPGLFLYAAEKMGVPAKECIVVEDSIHGINAAVAAKIKVLGFANEKNAEEFKKAGATVFFDMEKLPKLVEKCSKSMT